MSSPDDFRWARRVSRDKIRRLYALDAKGIVDEGLVDDVGYAMYARCESIRVATEAHMGRAACRSCGAIIRHRWEKEQPVSCECGWETTWGEYFKSYQHKQLVGGNAYPAFLDFLERWARLRTHRDKLVLIDALVHACHASARSAGIARPAAVNLIEGTASELIAFLDEIAYTDLSTPGSRAARDEWQALTGEKWWGRRPKPPSGDD
ncbi:MAG: hypothetical protein WEE64_15710 [Dehalococcoidia bacterium]